MEHWLQLRTTCVFQLQYSCLPTGFPVTSNILAWIPHPMHPNSMKPLPPSHTFILNCYSAPPVAQRWLMSIIHVYSCSYRSKCVPSRQPDQNVLSGHWCWDLKWKKVAKQYKSQPACLPACQPASCSHTARFMETIPSKELSFLNDL